VNSSNNLKLLLQYAVGSYDTVYRLSLLNFPTLPVVSGLLCDMLV